MENTEITDKDTNNTVSPVQTENSAAPADNEFEAAEAAAPEAAGEAAISEEANAKAPETPEEKARRLEAEARVRKAEKIAKVRSDVDFLCEHFPANFIKEGREDASPRPLRIGIFNDLVERIAAIDPEFSKSRIRAALRVYTTRWSYLECVKAGAPRIDIDGNEVDVVSQEHADYAAKEYQESRARYEAVLAERKKNRRPFFRKKSAENAENAAGGAEEQSGDGEQNRIRRRNDGDKTGGERRFRSRGDRNDRNERNDRNGRNPRGDRNDRNSGGERSLRRPFRPEGAPAKPADDEKPLGSRPREEFAPLTQEEIVPGLEVRVLWGSGSVPATVREVVRDKVTVELSMGMVVKVSSDQIGQK
ncbi:RNA chaperone ProQ [Succinimonas sp.]|uniref:RNA chaperone ProQ n=1 Tax=Succinimonas sp. TaxID=1936151 RepID=UPI00386F8A91